MSDTPPVAAPDEGGGTLSGGLPHLQAGLGRARTGGRTGGRRCKNNLVVSNKLAPPPCRREVVHEGASEPPSSSMMNYWCNGRRS